MGCGVWPYRSDGVRFDGSEGMGVECVGTGQGHKPMTRTQTDRLHKLLAPLLPLLNIHQQSPPSVDL